MSDEHMQHHSIYEGLVQSCQWSYCFVATSRRTADAHRDWKTFVRTAAHSDRMFKRVISLILEGASNTL